MFTVEVVMFNHFMTTSQYKVYLLYMFTVEVVMFNQLAIVKH